MPPSAHPHKWKVVEKGAKLSTRLSEGQNLLVIFSANHLPPATHSTANFALVWMRSRTTCAQTPGFQVVQNNALPTTYAEDFGCLEV